jgi:Rha family phage regulatory protein
MNECLDAALSELRAAGIEPDVSPGGKHIRITWDHNGASRLFVVPLTSSDWRAPMNCRSDVRKILKDDGLIGNEVAPVERPAIALRDGGARVSSVDIARHFGKAHKDVLRAVDRILEDTGEFGGRNFTPSSYLTDQSKELRAFDITRDGFSLLVMGFTGSDAMRWKLLYIEAFNAMEAEITASRAPLDRRLTKMEENLDALTSLFFDDLAPPRIIRSAGFVRIKPCIREKWLAGGAA